MCVSLPLKILDFLTKPKDNLPQLKDESLSRSQLSLLSLVDFCLTKNANFHLREDNLHNV